METGVYSIIVLTLSKVGAMGELKEMVKERKKVEWPMKKRVGLMKVCKLG